MVKLSELEIMGIYYSVGVCAIPHVDLVVDTWVYIGKRGKEFAFCQWWEYFKHVNDKSRKSLPWVGHQPVEDPINGGKVFLLVTRRELVKYIRNELKDL